MSLNTAQKQVLATVLKVGQRVGASPKQIKAAVETGLVESNFTNSPAMNDHDSQGWRQERKSLYPNPTNVAASAERFFRETGAVKDKYGSAGALAAAVQRPAAQYRGRYQQRSADAERLLAGNGGAAPRSTPGTPGRTTTQTTTSNNSKDVAAAEQDNQRRALVLGLITKHRGPNSLLVKSGVLAPKPVPGLETIANTRVTKTPGTPGSPSSATTAPGSATGAKATLTWAKSTIGVAETAGANRGTRVDSWEQRFGLKGQPWCAMFTSLAVTKGGVAKSGRTASVAEVRSQAQQGSAAYQRGFVPPQQAHAGDLILFGDNHIGLVESVGKGGITMIAGNDSNKVQRRTVGFGSGDIVRPKYRQ